MVPGKGAKWRLMWLLTETDMWKRLADKYLSFMVADDDLLMSTHVINTSFQVFMDQGLLLGQPSVCSHANSHTTQATVLQHPGTLVTFTAMVGGWVAGCVLGVWCRLGTQGGGPLVGNVGADRTVRDGAARGHICVNCSSPPPGQTPLSFLTTPSQLCSQLAPSTSHLGPPPSRRFQAANPAAG